MIPGAVLEGFVERLFLAPTLIAIAIVLMRFAFGIGNRIGRSDLGFRLLAEAPQLKPLGIDCLFDRIT
jgi:hypothetical protein